MLRRRLATACLALFLLCIPGAVPAVFAGEKGTAEEAVAMARRAVAYIRANGIEAAKKAFMAPGGEWHDRDLYVYVDDANGFNVIHGQHASLVGKNISDLSDVDGRFFVRDTIAVRGEGWIRYKWRNPQTLAIENKRAFIIEMDGKYWVGVGIYEGETKR